MKHQIQKFRQSSIVFEKPGILPKKLKTMMSSNCQRVAEILHMFPTYQCLEKVVWEFFCCLGLEVFANIILEKNWFLHTHRNHIFNIFITQNLNKI